MLNLFPPQTQSTKRRKLKPYSYEDKQRIGRHLTSTLSIPILIQAALLHQWKPTTRYESERKQAEAATVFLVATFIKSEDECLFNFTQLLALQAMNDSFTLRPKQAHKYGR